MAPFSVALAFLLAACGGLVPPQDVGDPLGLNDTQVAVTFAGGAGLLAPSAVQGTAGAPFSFDDYDIPNLPISPAGLTNDLSIATATLDRGEASAPATITLSDADVTVRIWQGAATYAEAASGQRAEIGLETAGTITLTRGVCDANSCTYDYDGTSPAFGVLDLSGSQFTAMWHVATQAPSPNSGTLSLTVSGDPDTLAGSTLTITLDAASGQITF